MAPSAPTPIVDGVSSISKLASFLRQARDITGQISFHSSLHNVATQLVRSSKPASSAELADMVQALDCDEPNLCARLSVHAFILVFAILGASKSSWPKHRGLYLLTESLTDSDRHCPSTQPLPSSLNGRALLSRKARIGTELLKPSVKHLCNRAANDGDRRWMGLLALELLKDCKENVRLLEGQSEDCQKKLGSTVINEHNELLRYVAGSIIRQLVCDGVSVGSFWPIGIDVVAHTAFLEPQVQSPHGLEVFEAYLDSLDSQTKYHNEKFVPFSHLLRLGQNTYTSPSFDSPSVLVTLEGLLSIVVLENDTKSGDNRAPQYIDVPLENITGVNVTKSIVNTSAACLKSHMRFTVHIKLDEIEDYTVYVNARAQRQPFVDLAFDDEDIADYLKTLIQTRQSRSNSIRGGTRSVLDGSRMTTDGTSLAVEHSPPKQLKPMETQNLRVTAMDADEILGRHLYKENSNLFDPVFASGNRSNRSNNMLHATRVSLVGSPMLASAGETETQFGTMIDAAYAMTTSNGDCLSLPRWNSGADTIENALELMDYIPDPNHDAMDNVTTDLQEEHISHDLPAAKKFQDTKRAQKVPETAAIDTADSAIMTGGPRPISALPNVPAIQRQSLSKVIQRLLGRDGQSLSTLGSGNRKPDRSTSTKPLRQSRCLKQKNTPEGRSKSSKGGIPHKMTPVEDVYDFPSSPPRVIKPQPAGKGRKNLAKSSTTKIQKSTIIFGQSKREIDAMEKVDRVVTDDYTQRKTTIIGFSMEGPRNQGVLPSSRAKYPILPQKVSNKAYNKPNLSVKRKRVDVQETTKSRSPKRVTKTPTDKRRRTVNVVPPTREADHPVYTSMTSPCLQSVSQKLNSQGTRVQENGSPRATADQVRRVASLSMDGLLSRLSDDGEVDLLVDEDREEETNAESLFGSLWKIDMGLPPMFPGLSLDESAPGRKHYVKRSSSNMKLQPSSPTAPSRMLEEMAAHKVQTDGQFVNLHTAAVVKTTIPQDPFLTKSPNPQSSFMQMLRASVQTNKDSRVQTEKEAGSVDRLFVDFISHHVDPDRTIVENKRSWCSKQPSSSPGNSSSSPSSGSKHRTLVPDSGEGDKLEGLAEVWQNALRKLYRGTTSSLYDVSNRLVKHLLDKESAIKDAVADYDTVGSRLVNALSGVQREHRRDSGVEINYAKQTLAKSLGTLEAYLNNELKETKSQQVQDLQRMWLEEQQKISSHFESAMITWGQ